MQPPPRPPHPTSQLTTYELRDYRRQLEHALKHLPEHATIRAQLAARLEEVLAEQESRSQQQRHTGHELILPPRSSSAPGTPGRPVAVARSHGLPGVFFICRICGSGHRTLI